MASPMVDFVEEEATRINVPDSGVFRNLTETSTTKASSVIPSSGAATVVRNVADLEVFRNLTETSTTKASAVIPSSGEATVVRDIPDTETSVTETSSVIPSSGAVTAERLPISPSGPTMVVHTAYSPARPAASPALPAELADTCIMEPVPHLPTPAATAQKPIPRFTQTVAMANPMLQPQPPGFSATYALDPQAPPAARPQMQSHTEQQMQSYVGPPPQDPRFMPPQGAQGNAMQGQPYGPPPYMQPMNAGAWPPNANAGMQPAYAQAPVAEPPKKRSVMFIAVSAAVAIAITGVVLLILGLLEQIDRLKKQPAAPVASSVVTAQSPPAAPPPPVVPPVVTQTPLPETKPPETQESPTPNPPVVTEADTTTHPPTMATTPRPPPNTPPPSVTTTPAAVDPNAFDKAKARARLETANGVLVACKQPGGATGPGYANVTFGSDGSVTSVAVEPPYGGTKEGDCVASQFRRVKVNSFEGAPQNIRHSFSIP